MQQADQTVSEYYSDPRFGYKYDQLMHVLALIKRITQQLLQHVYGYLDPVRISRKVLQIYLDQQRTLHKVQVRLKG